MCSPEKVSMGTWHSIDIDNQQSTHSNIKTVSDAFVNRCDSVMQVSKYLIDTTIIIVI